MATKTARKKSEDRITIHRSREGSHEVTVNRVVETTECERLASVSADSQTIGAFLDWLQNERQPPITLCLLRDDGSEYFWEAGIPINAFLAEYFEIDLDKVERERRGLLNALQEAQR